MVTTGPATAGASRLACRREYETLTAAASKVTSTEPTWSVRRTSPAFDRRRPIVEGAGWP